MNIVPNKFEVGTTEASQKDVFVPKSSALEAVGTLAWQDNIKITMFRTGEGWTIAESTNADGIQQLFANTGIRSWLQNRQQHAHANIEVRVVNSEDEDTTTEHDRNEGVTLLKTRARLADPWI